MNGRLAALNGESRIFTCDACGKIRLAALFPPGTPVEFKLGNMTCVHNGRVTRVCTYRGLGVMLLNTDTGADRKIPVSAIVDRPSSAAKPPVSLTPPTCKLCVRGLKPGEDRYECPCGNVFVREGGQ